MQNFSFGKKILVSFLCFLMPLAFMTYQIWSSHSVNIDFGEKEFNGSKYQESLMQIYTDLLNIQIQLILKKETSNEEKNYIFHSLKTIKMFKPLAESLSSDLEFTYDGLKKRQRENINLEGLEKLLTEISSSHNFENSLELTQKSINHVRIMIQHLGDTSNLILDPDLDSYYLVDVSLIKYLDYFEILEKINLLISRSLNKNQIELKSEFNFIKHNLKFNIFDKISSSVKTSLNEDVNFYNQSYELQKNMPKALIEIEKNIENLITDLELLSQNQLSPQQILDNLTTTNEKNLIFWLATNQELKNLLSLRIEALKQKRLFDLLFSLFCATMASIFTFYFSKSLVNSVNLVNDSLAKTISYVHNTGHSIATTSEQLSKAAITEAESIEESVRQIEMLSEMSKTTMLRAENTKQVTEHTNEIIHQGEKEVSRLAQTMLQIQESSKKIKDFTVTIDDIAFQTNLLALNAATEAAKAGDFGRGFAVVAESVRGLAQKSTESAKNIALLIQTSSEQIKQGTLYAEVSSKTFKDIIKQMTILNQLNQEIALSSKKQSEGLNEITLPLKQIDEISHLNAQSASMSSQTSQELLVQCAELEAQSLRLNTIVHGNPN